jgi:hypothetical protein
MRLLLVAQEHDLLNGDFFRGSEEYDGPSDPLRLQALIQIENLAALDKLFRAKWWQRMSNSRRLHFTAPLNE